MSLHQTRERAKALVEQGLVRAGRHVGATVPRLLNGAASFLETGRGLRAAGMALPAPVNSRYAVFDAAIQIAASAAQPVYLEFGVWQGDSIVYISRHLHQPDARFIGFDSFEGLPEDWTAAFGRGTFSTEGAAPVIADPRVSFVKGWFDDTLPTFTIPPHDRLIVSIDCDIYSAAATALAAIGPALVPGDLLYFDEFNDRLHEGRAFHEFRLASGQTYRVVAATAGAMNVLFERTG